MASYELGVKGTALSQRLRYGLASYWMTIDDMQVQQVIQPGSVQMTNAAAARSQAQSWTSTTCWADIGRSRPLALNRTRFREFNDLSGDHAGHHNPFAPDISGRLGLRYDSPQGWYAQANLSGMSKTYLDAATASAAPVLRPAGSGWRLSTGAMATGGLCEQRH